MLKLRNINITQELVSNHCLHLFQELFEKGISPMKASSFSIVFWNKVEHIFAPIDKVFGAFLFPTRPWIGFINLFISVILVFLGFCLFFFFITINFNIGSII